MCRFRCTGGKQNLADTDVRRRVVRFSFGRSLESLERIAAAVQAQKALANPVINLRASTRLADRHLVDKLLISAKRGGNLASALQLFGARKLLLRTRAAGNECQTGGND